MNLSQELKQLIYQYNGSIIIESRDIGTIFKEIESIRNNSKIEGYIFRPGFADSIDFKSYTVDDYMAIYAQWSLSFGWSDLFEEITETNPQTLLDNYLKDSVFKNISPLITEEKTPVVKDFEYFKNLIKSFVESKIPLTFHQSEILKNTPFYVLKEIYYESDISVKDIRVLLVSILLNDKTFNPFKYVKDIIPVLVENFAVKKPVDFIMNKECLRDVKVKMPNHIKRFALETLSAQYLTIPAEENFKKYQDFWKKVFRQLMIKGYKHTVKLYPAYENIHGLLYSKISSVNTEIEAYKKKGFLAEAFELEMKNPGSLIRNILFYLRNPIGRIYPDKIPPKFLNRDFSDKKKVSVQTDINDILYSDRFKEFLVKVNPKLLLQLKGLLSDERIYNSRGFKVINGKRISYSKDIPAVKKAWGKYLLELINDIYKKAKRKENSKRGKIFISEELKNFNVTYSGRLDINTNMSGNYLPIGSKIKIDIKDDSILRYGVSWKSPEKNPSLSICIDPSINILNGKFEGHVINWQAPTLRDKDILMSSSGDITQCYVHTFSTELIDIDISKMKEAGSTKMFSTVINYHNVGSLGEVDTHIFFNVIDKKDRILDGRQVSVALDQMDYSYKITDSIQAEIGLLFDLESETVEVLKMPLKSINPSSTATSLNSKFKEMIEARPSFMSVYEALIDVFDESQIVDDPDDPDDADLVLDVKTENFSEILF